jgi:hypothetical protein
VSEDALDQLYQLKLIGDQESPVLSYLLPACGRGDPGGRSDQAVELADASIKFSPDLPQPYFALAQALWHQNHFQPDKILLRFSRGRRHIPSLSQFRGAFL